MLETVAICLVIWFCWYYLKDSLRYKLPPGPWGFPIIGHLPLLGSHPHITFMRMKKTYGDVFRIRLGGFPTVVVNGVDSIRHALTKTGDDVIGRPAFMSNIANGDHVAFGLYTPAWKIHKKMTLSTLHAFVNEKNPMMQTIFEEVVEGMLNEFQSRLDQPFYPKLALYTATCGVPYKLCYGQEKDVRNDEDFKELLTKQQAFIDALSAGNPVDVMPWLRFFMPEKVRALFELLEYDFHLREKKTKEHRKTFQKSDIRDITDAILAVDYEDPEFKKVGFTEKRFLTTLDEYVVAAFDTTGTAFQWLLIYMILNPDIQEKVYAEVVDVIGDRLPKMNDRKFLPYTEATIVEAMRIKTPIPMGLPHSTMKDTRINGYDVPKDTVVLFNLHSMAHDPDIWSHPEKFRPDRFLNPDGTLNQEKTNIILPFSAGPRKCPGDILARMMLFMFFTALVQRFKFCSAQEQYDLVPCHGLTDYPKPYKILVKERT